LVEYQLCLMKLVILDRDGVINEDSDEYIKSPEEWVPIPGSLEAIARLNQAGYRVLVFTNQSGIARGLYGAATLSAMHQKMNSQLAQSGGYVDAVFFCPHSPSDRCECRKPKPGLLREISRRLHTDLDGVPVVGDSLRDIEAAQGVGARPVLVLTGKGIRTQKAGRGLDGVSVYDDLADFAKQLLGAKGARVPKRSKK
jgi:D-glycero-D-manno-heptose 1,7-bisphosphate phosphatase